jgi:hypothetical protein
MLFEIHVVNRPGPGSVCDAVRASDSGTANSGCEQRGADYQILYFVHGDFFPGYPTRVYGFALDGQIAIQGEE